MRLRLAHPRAQQSLTMHVTDDRGTRVRLIPHRKLGVLPGIPSPIPMDARHRMYAEGQEVQWSRDVLISIVVGLLFLFLWGTLCVIFSPRMINWFAAPPMVKGLLMGLLPSLPLPLLIYFMVRAGRHRIARIVVKHGFCATCGYALAGLAPADDGCTTCPECGSAWRVPMSMSP